jgi:hypothetical protein
MHSSVCVARRIRLSRLTRVLMLGLILGLAAGVSADPGATVNVTEDTGTRILLNYEFGPFHLDTVDVDGMKCTRVTLDKESQILNAGAPDVPHVCRSLVIPDQSRMEVRILSSQYKEMKDVDVLPSKGNLLRTVDPATVPYTFGEAYATDAFYPGDVVFLRDPYIMRDCRGQVVVVNPVQYNPVTRVLRLYTELEVEVVAAGQAEVNALEHRPDTLSRAFHDLYSWHFINYASPMRYTPLDEDGDMLIICHDAWLGNIQPLADHKNARGIDTTVVAVSTIGNNYNSIAAYIQQQYDTSDLAFVLLVGDDAEVDPYGSPPQDPRYALTAGADDYPDIMVGRFSAQTAAHVDTQVLRTITYETMPATNQDWFYRGMGVSSNQGPGDDGEYDDEHIGYIRDDLLAYGYTEVDQIHDPYGTDQMVTDGLNAGRGIINYCGHGSSSSWSSTGFNISDINALTNDNMLPFICSVACVNGEFDGQTCFAEAWLRATNGGVPTGAIAAYMSSINQSWDPPMDAQDEFVDMYVAEAYSSVGTLFFAGSCHMMDEYGSGGVDMFETWHIFGDPSLRVIMSCTDMGTLSIDRETYACEDTVAIQVIDCGLNLDDGVVDTAEVVVSSDTEMYGEVVVLTELGPDTGQFAGTVDLVTADVVGAVQVSAGDTVTVHYVDADNGEGGYDVDVYAYATVDCTPPMISDVATLEVEPRSALVGFTTNEPAQGTVRYGLSCGALDGVAQGSGYTESPVVSVTTLQDNTTYFYAVEAADEAGNLAFDDNGGACYTFTTPAVPDFFTEWFEDDDNDLDNLSLMFTPGDPVDFYSGCVVGEIDALPTDPSTGTVLSLSDDDSEAIHLSGAQVSLYGVAYSTVYVNSNGNLTFGASDTEYQDTLDDHFRLPRISVLFDDFNPSSGGTVSWEQLDDRLVVSYVNVPEFYTSNSNTFQAELYFDGTIVVSYLGLDAADGLAGLSEGEDLDPDYYESDLSSMLECGAALSIITSDPADGAIDACKPHDADNAGNLYGWDRLTLVFDGAVDGVSAADFTVDEIGGDGVAPDILAVMLLDTEIVEVLFTERIEPLAWTVLTYVPSGQTVTLGFLPGDTNQDGFAGTFDVLALIDHLNGAITLPGYYATDIDRSNETNSFDVLEVINLLNGAAEYDVYNEAQLP